MQEKKIKIPSVSEIMNLVRKHLTKTQIQNQAKEIIFIFTEIK